MARERLNDDLNVLGGPLLACSYSPLTGWTRTGCCEFDVDDAGMHTVCVRVDADFLAYSRSVGNDLATPHPEARFPGLKPGDRWCLCATRWLQAHEAGHAPAVVLAATHIATLSVVPLELLEAYAHDV